MASVFDDELKRRRFGAADSDPAMFTGGALSAFNTLAGGSKQGQEAMALAQALSPKRQEFDPAIAALKYFTGLTREASKPGATLIGAGAAATIDPAEYLLDLNQYNKKLDSSLPQTAISLATALKPPKSATGSSTYKSVVITMDDGTTRQDYVPVTDIPKLKALENVVSVLEDKSGQSGSTSFKAYGVGEGNLAGLKTALNLPSLTTDADGNVLLTDAQAAIGQTQGLIIPKITPESDSSETPQWVTVTETVASEEEGGEPTINKSTKLLTPTEINALGTDANKTVTKMEALFTYKDIRDAYSKDQDFKDFKALQTNFDKVNTSYEQAYNLASPKVADLSMIFAYMKMLDPRSVVREGEQQQARGTGGMFDYLANTYNSLLGEGSLTDLQRKSFRDAAFAFYTKNATLLTELNGRIVNEAQNQNIQNVGDFIIQPRTYLEPDNLPNGDPNPKAGQSTLKVFAKYPGDDKITDPTQVSLEDLSFLLTAPITTRLTEANKNKIRAEITRRTQ
jgi:hypothetical protein